MYSLDGANPWIVAASRAARRAPGWLAAAGAMLFSAGVLFFFKSYGPAIQTALGDLFKTAPDAWRDGLIYCALQLVVFVAFLVAALAATRWEGRSPLGARPAKASAVPLGVAIGAGGFLSAVGVAAVAGAITFAPAIGAPPVVNAPAGLLVLGFLTVAIQSLSEELFFRGWLQPRLGDAWGPLAGLIVTSLVFGGLHVIAGAQGVLAVVNLLLGGLMFGLLALRTGNIYAAAAAHIAWNWTESGAVGLNPDPTGSLAHFGFKGAELWNGGQDTMNGSLATSIVLIALVAALATAPRWAGARVNR